MGQGGALHRVRVGPQGERRRGLPASRLSRILDKLSPTLDNTVERAKEDMESALHRTFGSAKRLRDTRPIMAVIDGTTLKIGVLGEARLLGITVPPEAQARARAYLEQACLRDGAPRRLVVHLFKEKMPRAIPSWLSTPSTARRRSSRPIWPSTSSCSIGASPSPGASRCAPTSGATISPNSEVNHEC